jgi:hypothetical protein
LAWSIAKTFDRLWGSPYGGRIALLPGQSKPEEFTAPVHETTHEFLHHAERHTDKIVRETEAEAEAVAFVVAKAVGLNASTSVAYIQLYQGDAELLIESLKIVQQTASLILSAIQPDESRTSASQFLNSPFPSTEPAPSAASVRLPFHSRTPEQYSVPVNTGSINDYAA